MNCVTPSLNPYELISIQNIVSFFGDSMVWTDVIPLLQPRVRFSAVTVGTKTFFFGGENGFDSLCSCYPTTDEILVLQQVDPTAAPTPAPTPAPTTLKPTPAPTTPKPTAASAPNVSKKPSTSSPNILVRQLVNLQYRRLRAVPRVPVHQQVQPFVSPAIPSSTFWTRVLSS
jgi:hypothetical protein